ncbi:hypothetical protein PGT21_019512 [Puccinia graminis f. sp. tritici]|uniref:Uncharacterized protein n=1 Tax=Puccinia graminis f. sp. tritici TaxID=56615 RepID=A0A5B0MMD0_PUCGR|nr:hypothetical protein PGTUg99_005096 [Puccinia graminis f. sp. tritici]KAA1084162.1 hypothetical protein PGT21_019512 [Puccinia graminis f. sp. tritici]
MISSRNPLSRLTLQTLFLFNLSIHLAFSTRIPFGPMSELTGSAAIIDKILSPGNPRNPAPSSASVPTKTTNSTTTRKSNKDGSMPDYYGSTCSISFTRRSNNQPRSLQERISRRALDPSREDERSALFLTEAAEKCVDSSRAWGATAGYPLGVGVCYSVGYVDEPKSTVGGQINVFRLGTVSELSRISGMDADELEESTRLELSFLSQNAPGGSAEYSKSSIEGALRFSQAPWAPFDDPQHLINPTNPQFTASYGDTEMVLIGSFHLNLMDAYVPKASRIRKRDNVDRVSALSPSGARLVRRETPILESHFFDLSDHPTKRSPLAGTHPWGLFKRQAVAPISSDSEFSSDTACSDAGLSANSFFSGDGKEALPPIEDRRKSFVSPSTTAPLIPPSPFLSPAQREANATYAVPSTFMAANSLLAASGINFNVTAYQLPGRYLMVLPVGLIIYGALSLIGFLTVMAVTYERKQYRDQFRKRKKEQQGLPSGDFDNFSDRRV